MLNPLVIQDPTFAPGIVIGAAESLPWMGFRPPAHAGPNHGVPSLGASDESPARAQRSCGAAARCWAFGCHGRFIASVRWLVQLIGTLCADAHEGVDEFLSIHV